MNSQPKKKEFRNLKAQGDVEFDIGEKPYIAVLKPRQSFTLKSTSDFHVQFVGAAPDAGTLRRPASGETRRLKLTMKDAPEAEFFIYQIMVGEAVIDPIIIIDPDQNQL